MAAGGRAPRRRAGIATHAASVTKERINPPSVFRSLDHGFSQAVVASGRKTLYVVDYGPEKAEAVASAFRHFVWGEAQPASTWVGGRRSLIQGS